MISQSNKYQLQSLNTSDHNKLIRRITTYIDITYIIYKVKNTKNTNKIDFVFIKLSAMRGIQR